jgi:hypothetical protein
MAKVFFALMEKRCDARVFFREYSTSDAYRGSWPLAARAREAMTRRVSMLGEEADA